MAFYHLEFKHSICVLLVLIRCIFYRLFCACIKKENSNKKDWLRYPTILYSKTTHLKLLFKFVVPKFVFFSHNISVCSFKPLIQQFLKEAIKKHRSHLDVFFEEMSVQVFFPLFTWVVCFSDIELYYLFVYFGY